MGRKKKIHLDENGNPCGWWQTPEAIAKRQRPEAKEQKRIADKIRNKKPENRAKKSAKDKADYKRKKLKGIPQADYQRRKRAGLVTKPKPKTPPKKPLPVEKKPIKAPPKKDSTVLAKKGGKEGVIRNGVFYPTGWSPAQRNRYQIERQKRTK